MDIAPYLETDRLVLGPTRLRDVVFYWRLAGDPVVRQFLGGPVAWRHRLFKFYRCLRGHPKAGIWVVRRRGHTAAIGLVALRPHIDGADYEVSYAFKPASWGQGFAREAAARVVEHAIHDLALKRVVAETQPANVASCQLLATLGFTEEIRVARFGVKQVIFGICRHRQAAVCRCGPEFFATKSTINTSVVEALSKGSAASFAFDDGCVLGGFGLSGSKAALSTAGC